MRRPVLALAAALATALAAWVGLVPRSASAAELPLFDAHVHYSHDAVEMVPVADVVALMRKAGLRSALVSSSDDAGTQKLLAAAPDLIVPSLRPYRLRSDVSSWIRNDVVLAYVEDRLRRFRYAALGEFHLYGTDADLPIPRRMVELAVRNNLVLHAHSDVDAIERLFRQAPGAKILWAHSGFERPAAVRDLLRKHRTLWADLAFRSDMGGSGKVDPDWAEVFREFPDRFMVGTDTFTPERLHYIPEHASFSRGWLSALPADLAERIAWRNADALIAPVWQANRKRPLPPSAGESIIVDAPMLATADAGGAPQSRAGAADAPSCADDREAADVVRLRGTRVALAYSTEPRRVRVGQPFGVRGSVCPLSRDARVERMSVDGVMPEHRHGMNYVPRVTLAGAPRGAHAFSADGLMFHMPGRWQLLFDVRVGDATERLSREVVLR